MNTVSFPGLGIEEINLNPVAFSLFGRNVAWYGIIIVCAMIIAFFYARFRAVKYEGIKGDHMLDYAIFGIVAAIIGARLFYVVTYDGEFKTFLDVIAIWNGGLAIYGGIIGGVIAVVIVSLVKKINCLKVLDSIGPAVMIAQAIGRWGNFINAEAHGTETDLPWRMGILENGVWHYYHPTFLYESLWNVLGFVLINLIYKKKKFNGQILLAYLTWYGFGRMFIEGLRTDSLYIGSTGIRISQLIGLVSFVLGLIAIIVLLAIRKKVGTESKAGKFLYVIGPDSADEESSQTAVSDEAESEVKEAENEQSGEDIAEDTVESDDEGSAEDGSEATEAEETEEKEKGEEQ